MVSARVTLRDPLGENEGPWARMGGSLGENGGSLGENRAPHPLRPPDPKDPQHFRAGEQKKTSGQTKKCEPKQKNLGPNKKKRTKNKKKTSFVQKRVAVRAPKRSKSWAQGYRRVCA